MRPILLFLSILLAASAAGSANAASYRSAPSEPVTNGFDPVQRAADQRALHDQLWAEKLVVTEPGVRVRLNDEDRRALGETVNQGNHLVPAERRQRIGVVKPVAHGVDFAGMGAAPTRPKAFAGGQLLASGGGLTWTALVRAEGATASRLHFTAVNLPEGAELFVFNERGQAYGPYTGSGRNGNGAFWSEALVGSDTYVHLRVPDALSAAELRGLRFVINDVGHIGPDYKYVDVWSSCEGNAGCVELIQSDGGNISGAVSDARDAVAHMQFVSGAFIYFCSGGLINDTDAGSATPPYFLTANHCISKNNEASSLQAYFNFVRCNDSIQPPMVSGASILSSSRSSDYTLMQLDEAPAGATLLGWTSAAIASSNNTMLYRISHPSGAPQAYSEHRVSTSRPTCRSWPRGPWIYSDDERGATEGGSSGSPVVNGEGQVVGQLSGACGYETSNVCSDRNATVDGALAAYFDNVAQWLDPAPSGGNNPPIAGFSINGDDDPTVVFTDTSTDPDDDSISSWAWDFGDGGVSSVQSPAHSYACNGTYNVTLTVEDTFGASGTASNTVPISNAENCATSKIGVLSMSGHLDTSGRRPAVTFTIDVATSNNGDPSGAIVSGTWSGVAKGSGSCTVSGSSCEVTKGNIRGSSGDLVTFTVTGIELSGYTFDGDEKFGTVQIP